MLLNTILVLWCSALNTISVSLFGSSVNNFSYGGVFLYTISVSLCSASVHNFSVAVRCDCTNTKMSFSTHRKSNCEVLRGEKKLLIVQCVAVGCGAVRCDAFLKIAALNYIIKNINCNYYLKLFFQKSEILILHTCEKTNTFST